VKVIPSIPFLRVVIIIVLVLFFHIYSYFKTVLLDAEMCICVLGFILYVTIEKIIIMFIK